MEKVDILPNDEIIIMSYVQLDESELEDWEAEILFFNDKNEIINKCKKK